MNKKMAIAALLIGILLLIASVVAPAVSTANTNIIGGPGWPTFVFHFGKTAYLAVVGGLLVAAALLLRKK